MNNKLFTIKGVNFKLATYLMLKVADFFWA